MIALLRLGGIAIASLFIAAIAMALVGPWLPQVLGPWTVPVATLLLGGLIFRDFARDSESKPAYHA